MGRGDGREGRPHAAARLLPTGARRGGSVKSVSGGGSGAGCVRREPALSRKRLALDRKRLALPQCHLAASHRSLALPQWHLAVDQCSLAVDQCSLALNQCHVALNQCQVAADQRRLAGDQRRLAAEQRVLAAARWPRRFGRFVLHGDATESARGGSSGNESDSAGGEAVQRGLDRRHQREEVLVFVRDRAEDDEAE